jgi:hypothetical protein
MPKFKVGDTVERIGPLIPDYMRNGVITKVLPNRDGIEWLTEYEVRFSDVLVANFYETQLRESQLR